MIQSDTSQYDKISLFLTNNHSSFIFLLLLYEIYVIEPDGTYTYAKKGEGEFMTLGDASSMTDEKILFSEYIDTSSLMEEYENDEW